MFGNSEYIALANPTEARALFLFLKEYSCDRDRLNQRVAKINSFSVIKINLDKLAMEHIIIILADYEMSKGSVEIGIFNKLIENCYESNLISRLVLGNMIFMNINIDKVRWLLELGALENAIKLHFQSAMASAIPHVAKLIVEKDGIEYTGTAFICISGNRSQFIVTNRHNIEDNAYVKIISTPGAVIGRDIEWVAHPDLDIAIANVSGLAIEGGLRLWESCPVLTEVVTIGYPSVPNSKESQMLAHRGEVNAQVSSFLQRGLFYIISNNTSPGSSGSPVINKYGLVIGMVTNSFESKMEDRVFSMQAALCANQIIEFIDQ